MEYMRVQSGLVTEMKSNSAIRDRRIFLNGNINEDTSFETCYFIITECILPCFKLTDSFSEKQVQ